MYYIFEPQRDMNAENGSDPEDTCFQPCSVGEATIFAVFSKETLDPSEDPIWVCDADVEAVLKIVRAP